MLLRRCTVLLLAALCATAGAETVDERIKATNLNDAEQVYELAVWCGQNNLPSKARQYYAQVIKLDPEHEGARGALGQVKVNDRWVSAKAVAAMPAKPGAAAAPAGGGAPAAGPGPTQIDWNLKPPVDPRPHDTFIDTYFERMVSSSNDSREMDAAVATVCMAEQVDHAVPRLCARLLDPSFTDVYGPSMVLLELLRQGRARQAQQLLPFVVETSRRATGDEDLATFAAAAGAVKDKRVMPRLLELLETGSEEVQQAALDGIHGVTLLPLARLDLATAKSWWGSNHGRSDKDIYLGQLKSTDDTIAIEAAKALFNLHEKAIFPVLGKLMVSDDRIVRGEAIAIVQRATNSDWSYKPDATPAELKKSADLYLAWWKENENRYQFPEDPAAKAAAAAAAGVTAIPVDPNIALVQQLASVQGTQATEAEARLLAAGKVAVPALLDGLADQNRLLRRKCAEVIVKITKVPQPFDAAAADEQRASEIEAWRAELIKSKVIADPAAEPTEEREEEPAPEK